MKVAKRGSGVAKCVRDLYENETKKSALSKSNSLNYKYIDEIKELKKVINMGYIMNLRKFVGHEPLIGIGATTLVFNDKKELLLNLRSDTNTWGIPGGSMELFETIEDTAIRELKEEAGILANDLELVTVLSGKDYYFEYPNGDKMCTVIVLFKVTNYNGKIHINDDESKQLKFFNINNLPNMESRAKNIIDLIINNK